MAENQILREKPTSILKISGSTYIRVPSDFINDSSFPLIILKDKEKKLKKGIELRIKMLKDKLVIEEHEIKKKN